MPALYAHDRFGEKVSEKSDGELKNIIFKYYNQYEVGLQGPDILFFYRPYHGNDVENTEATCMPFLLYHSLSMQRKL